MDTPLHISAIEVNPVDFDTGTDPIFKLETGRHVAIPDFRFRNCCDADPSLNVRLDTILFFAEDVKENGRKSPGINVFPAFSPIVQRGFIVKC